MTINYGPYEPPPPTVPPPAMHWPAPEPRLAEPDAPRKPASPPSSTGQLLSVVGIGLALIGMFALPLQRYGSNDDPSYVRDVGYVQLHDLVHNTSFSVGPDPAFASPLAKSWWAFGLVAVCSLLVAAVGIMCVGSNRVVVRPAATLAAVGAIAAIAGQATALHHTADYRSAMFEYPAARSMFHDAGLGIWLGFAGLTAVFLGAVLTAAAWSRARR